MRLSILASLFALLLPITATAQSFAGLNGTARLELSYADIAGGAVTGLTGSLSSTYPLGNRTALQFDRGVRLLTDDTDTRLSATLGAHPYVMFGERLALGGYLLAEVGSDDPVWSVGVAADYRTRWGFGAELALGETRGGRIASDGYVTNKTLVLDYTGNSGWRGLIYFHKDALNEPGVGDRDYYDYGFGADISLGGDRDMVLEVRAGQVRYDALDADYTQVSVGLRIPLGDAGEPPVFGERRTVLQRLTQY